MLYTQEIEKKISFSRQKYYESGPKFMKILAWKLRKQQADQTIYRIRDPVTNTIQNKQENIQTVFEMFYKKLYSKMPEDKNKEIDIFLDKLELPTLTDEQNKLLTAEITETEVKKAITKLKCNKSPGPDGFTGEWYRAFQKEIIPILARSFNWTLKNATVPPSWKEAIISIIPKEDKDKLQCGSYRPLSVLNVDYRLYTSIMARRMEDLMPNLINQDQSGFIRQRQTNDNIRRTLHVMNHIRRNKITAMILSLDAEKAFDSVSWTYLYKVLHKFGFHETIIKSIQALYDTPTAKIKINGHLSNSFTLERGTRQGCPWSPQLFALYLEPLVQSIRQNKTIQGINIKGVEHKIACYADDVLIYLRNPTTSLPYLMEQLQNSGPISGYKLNIEKTEIITYNYNPPTNIKNVYSLKWHTKSFKYLGIHLTKNTEKIQKMNFDPITAKTREDLTRWNLIPFFSFSSRIETIKMNIVPKFLYLFQCLPVEIPEKQFIEWDKMLSRFIWQGKKPRVRFKTLQLPKDKGGWALPSLKDYYIAAQIRTIVNWCDPHYHAPWKDIENLTFRNTPVQAILIDEKLQKYTEQIEDPWTKLTLNVWTSVMKEFNLLKYCTVLKWIAYDSDFTPNRLDNRFKLWANKGITSFSTIIKKGEILSFQQLKDNFLLENQDFYRYLQVRNYYDQKIKGKLEDNQNPLIDIIKKAHTSGIKYKIVSLIYKSLRSMKTQSTNYIKEKWETESGTTFTDEEWTNIWEFQWKSTSSLNWKENCWKNIIRYFKTPALTAKYTNKSPKCWRNCGCNKANHYHIFWECMYIQEYWKEIQEALEYIFEKDIPLESKLLYFGCVDPDMVTADNKYLMRALMAASKKAITRKWLQQERPTLSNWIDATIEIYTMERITFVVNLKKDIFLRKWRKWVEYILVRRPDFIAINE